MANQGSSFEKRGLEILFGEPPPVEIKPRGATLVVGQPLRRGPEPRAAAGEPEIKPLRTTRAQDLERALFEEAQDGALAPGERAEPGLADEPPPATPEIEQALFAEAVDAEEPPEPVAEPLTPALEETMDEQNLEAQDPFYEPPPPEVSDVSDGVLPPRSQSIYFGGDQGGPLAAYDIQGTGGAAHLELPERHLSAKEQQEIIMRLGEPRLKELDEEISQTYDQVLAQVGENSEIAAECYNLLLKARDIVLRRDAARIPQAEYYVELVRARLKQSAESEASVKKYAWWITTWGFLWGGLYLAALILLNHPQAQALLTPISGSSLVADTEMFLRAMLWGGIGGVVAVLYGLFKHAGRRDFDSQYNLSYVGKPFLGLVLGATVYMVFQLMATTGFLPAALQVESGAAVTVTPWIVYPLAWAGGFKENQILDLVNRIIKRAFFREEGRATSPPDFRLGKS